MTYELAGKIWKRATRTSGDLHNKNYEEKLSKLKLFSSVKRKPKWREWKVFQNIKSCFRVERIPLIFMLIGNSMGKGAGYLLREGKETIWFSCFSVILWEVLSTLVYSVLFHYRLSLNLVQIILPYSTSYHHFKASMLLYSEEWASIFLDFLWF